MSYVYPVCLMFVFIIVLSSEKILVVSCQKGVDQNCTYNVFFFGGHDVCLMFVFIIVVLSSVVRKESCCKLSKELW